MPHKRPILAPMFLAALCAMLLWLAVPRLMAELMLVPGTSILERLMRNEPVDDAELDTIIQSRLDALEYVVLPDAHANLGTAYLVKAQRADDVAMRMQLLQVAEAKLRAALRLEPYNAYAWLRLSNLCLLATPERTAEALEAWHMSLKVGAFDPFLFLNRFHVGILLYDVMSEEDIVQLKAQLQGATDADFQRTVRYVERNKLVDWVLFLSPPDSALVKRVKTPRR